LGIFERLVADIAEEVTSGILEYRSHKQENEELMTKIKIKLANKENLEPDEYAFVAERRML
jgi:hypothetical protein